MNHKICNRLLRREEVADDGNLYSYELSVREGNTTADWRLPLYSIKVNMTDITGKSREEDAKDVFSSRVRADEFFDKIVKNLATPIDLAYIIEDEMAD